MITSNYQSKNLKQYEKTNPIMVTPPHGNLKLAIKK